MKIHSILTGTALCEVEKGGERTLILLYVPWEGWRGDEEGTDHCTLKVTDLCEVRILSYVPWEGWKGDEGGETSLHPKRD